MAQPCKRGASRDLCAIDGFEQLDIVIGPDWLVWYNDIKLRDICGRHQAIAAGGIDSGQGGDRAKLSVLVKLCTG